MSDATGAPSPAELRFPLSPPVPLTCSTSPTHWYKDAVIYQVHVRGFFDSDDDGVGDFAGLTRRLDYIQSPRRLVHLAAAVLPVAAARRRRPHRALRRRSQVVRHAEGFPDIPRRSACARAACHHRAGHQSHLGSTSVVPGRAPAPLSQVPARPDVPAVRFNVASLRPVVPSGRMFSSIVVNVFPSSEIVHVDLDVTLPSRLVTDSQLFGPVVLMDQVSPYFVT